MSLSHIDNLVRDHTLPQPALSTSVIKAVLDVLTEAWAEVCSRYPQEVADPEVEVSKHLALAFNHRCGQDMRLKRAVLKAIPGPEMLNFDGTHLQKRPDITVEWRANRLSPLIVECKLIDAPSRKTLDLYSRNGVLRFVEGEYAWSEQEAVMVAFVRDNSKVSALSVHFSDEHRALMFKVEEMPSNISEESARGVATTRHGRSFAYPLRPGVLPGPITLWHLWLNFVVEESRSLEAS